MYFIHPGSDHRSPFVGTVGYYDTALGEFTSGYTAFFQRKLLAAALYHPDVGVIEWAVVRVKHSFNWHDQLFTQGTDWQFDRSMVTVPPTPATAGSQTVVAWLKSSSGERVIVAASRVLFVISLKLAAGQCSDLHPVVDRSHCECPLR